MITAKVVVKDKFWIIQEDGVSLGQLRFEDDGIAVVVGKTSSRFNTIEEAKTSLGIGEAATNLAPGNVQLQDAMGYPTDLEQVYNAHDDQGLPCYTKSKNSKVVHAAGWYGMLRNDLYAEAFCPKVNTLRNYPHIGPFRNQTDLRVAMTSWKRNDQTGPITARQVLS